MNTEQNQAFQLEKLRDKLKRINIAMLTTVKPNGELVSRPMYSAQMDDNGCIWFFSNDTSGKVTDLQHYEKVNLGYSDPSNQIYISVSGDAELISNPIKKDE